MEMLESGTPNQASGARLILSSMGTNATSHLAKAASSTNAQARSQGLIGLGVAPSVVPGELGILLGAIRQTNGGPRKGMDRLMAIEDLGKFVDTSAEAVEELTRLLSDPSRDIRMQARSTLILLYLNVMEQGTTRGPSNLSWNKEFLESLNSPVAWRKAVANALEALRSGEFIPKTSPGKLQAAIDALRKDP